MSYPFDCITDLIFVETEIAPADVILVPGGSLPQIMEKAASLYHQGMAPYILPSGGSNPRVTTTEWDFLQKVGIANGVPQSAILKENQAQHTFHNAQFSFDVLKKNGIHPQKVIMVCKSWHSRRALMTYQTVFPKETEFMMATVADRAGVDKDNWFQTDNGIRRVMTEVEKIGSYFGSHISGWV
ncbi:YdcF family protein [Falsibacillus albus]|uniref:YdcF family protein n=1 Tax=Falsibacillus albus TaxID=2478915 RepID=A0A3L7JXV8_9BACI|nr:YdcF family protein [Falsibacillus albus]RLQ94511.1 YdcF family protein [Falsibacillus albus]